MIVKEINKSSDLIFQCGGNFFINFFIIIIIINVKPINKKEIYYSEIKLYSD